MTVGAFWRPLGVGSAQRSDYSHLSGYSNQSVRVDPHMHVAPKTTHIDLAKVVELVRARPSAPVVEARKDDDKK